MLRLLLISLPLMALWLLMSGIFKPLLIAFGVISCGLAVWFMHRMEKADNEIFKISVSPIKIASYLIWLMKEIAVSTLNVTKIVLQQRPNYNQKLFSIPITQESDIGQVIFANSITLTPGTITVETEPGYFLVHALDHQPADYDALADMDHRVTSTENLEVEKK